VITTDGKGWREYGDRNQHLLTKLQQDPASVWEWESEETSKQASRAVLVLCRSAQQSWVESVHADHGE